MKCAYRALGGKLTFEVDGSDTKSIFEGIAKLQEIFEDSTCGCCGKTNVRLRVRSIEDNKYYELHCADCNANFAFGQHKVGGGLFPKTKDKEGNWLPNKGWSVWKSRAAQAEGGEEPW